MARAFPGSRPDIWAEASAVSRRTRRRLRERRCRLATRPRLIDDRREVVTVLEGLDLLVDRQPMAIGKCG